jgi:DNA gyrase/topoisomerase IV subunit A
MLFNVHDDPLLKSNFDDNLKIEPEWYCPIIPMVLVNGAEGIGMGWSTKIPNFDVREIIANLKRMLDGDDPLPMVNSESARYFIVPNPYNYSYIVVNMMYIIKLSILDLKIFLSL